MDYTGKIRITRAEDRQTIAGILSANKYQVWQGTEKVKKSPTYYLYYKDIKEEPENEGKVHGAGGAAGKGEAQVRQGGEPRPDQNAG